MRSDCRSAPQSLSSITIDQPTKAAAIDAWLSSRISLSLALDISDPKASGMPTADCGSFSHDRCANPDWSIARAAKQRSPSLVPSPILVCHQLPFLRHSCSRRRRHCQSAALRSVGTFQQGTVSGAPLRLHGDSFRPSASLRSGALADHPARTPARATCPLRLHFRGPLRAPPAADARGLCGATIDSLGRGTSETFRFAGNLNCRGWLANNWMAI